MIVFSAFSMFPIDITGSETGDGYRRKITVDNTNNPNALIDYQVFINVTYDSDMQPDFDDLRFTWYNETSGQEVGIDYWLDKHVDSQYAFIWVKVPHIKGLGQEILHVYYGDSEAVSGSDGEETFVFFDDFSVDTMSEYVLWHGNEENGFNWNPNGWLFVNASILERDFPNPKCGNVGVRHKTTLTDATEEKYCLETRLRHLAQVSTTILGLCILTSTIPLLTGSIIKAALSE